MHDFPQAGDEGRRVEEERDAELGSGLHVSPAGQASRLAQTCGHNCCLCGFHRSRIYSFSSFAYM